MDKSPEVIVDKSHDRAEGLEILNLDLDNVADLA